MPSPLLVLDVARTLPSWNPAGERSELEPFVRNVRAALVVLIAGERGAGVAPAAFARRAADPQDPEKRPSYEGLSAQERAALTQLGGQVQAEAVQRGIVPAAPEGGAGVRFTRGN